MREYQQQAIELGFLHDRFLRGTAPPDFAERGTQMVQRLAGAPAVRHAARSPRRPGAAPPAGLDR